MLERDPAEGGDALWETGFALEGQWEDGASACGRRASERGRLCLRGVSAGQGLSLGDAGFPLVSLTLTHRKSDTQSHGPLSGWDTELASLWQP